MRTPMTIVTGPLGSGKTTLLRHILSTATRRIAVIMNEFGEIAIDSKIVEGKAIRIAELAGGCVCCSLAGEFEAAVTELIQTVAPEHMVVETTGVAEPDGLILNVEDNLPQIRLDGVVVVADADGVVRFPQLGRTEQMQLESADIVLINKIDLVPAEQLAQVEEKIQRLNRRAIRLRTVRCQIEPAVLFGLEAAHPPVRPAISSHAPKVEVVTFTTDRQLDRARFERDLAAHLPPAVYRAKGFVYFSDGGALFNAVAGRWELEPWDVKQTELVFIGQGITTLKDELLSRLHACEIG